LIALVIPWVGKKTAKTLALLFDSKQSLLDFNITKEELEALQDIGPEVANNVVEFFQEKKSFISRLLEVIEIEFSKKVVWEGVFTNKKICITGSFENYTRDQLIAIIEENWGEFVSSVSVKTNFLLAWEKAWSKLLQAQKFWIKIISLELFFDMIKQ
jgi:DNA ligase (NAD+)